MICINPDHAKLSSNFHAVDSFLNIDTDIVRTVRPKNILSASMDC